MHFADNGNVNGGFGATIDNLKLDCDARICGAEAQLFRAKLFEGDRTCHDIRCVRSTQPDRQQITQATKLVCNSFNRDCNRGEICLTGCAPGNPDFQECAPTICVDPPGAPVTLEEAFARRSVQVRLLSSSSLVMRTADGTTTQLAVSGQGSIDGFPCRASVCAAEAVLLGKLSDAAVQGVSISNATFSMGVRGLSFANGRLVVPGSSTELAVSLDADGSRRFIHPVADVPLTGEVDLASRTFLLSGQVTDSDNTTLTFSLVGDLTNLPPHADAGSDSTVECSSPSGASVTFDGSGSVDSDGPLRSYAWRVVGGPMAGRVIGVGPTASIVLPIGRHEVRLTIQDSSGQFATDDVVVVVQDTTPPRIDEFTFTPSCLWPPNHNFARYELGASARASDSCTGATARFVAVGANEPVYTIGSGNSAPNF